MSEIKYLIGVQCIALFLLGTVSSKKIRANKYNAQSYIGTVFSILISILIVLLGMR